jgi:hypothetical protein
VKCPPFAETMIISDDADLASRLASLFAEPNHYLAIIEGPRLTRNDSADESTECSNAVRRVMPKRLILAGLAQEAVDAILERVPSETKIIVLNADDFEKIIGPKVPRLFRLPEQFGMAALEAMRKKAVLSFANDGTCPEPVSSPKGHVVVCEVGHPMSEVIAASYAFALGASLTLIPQVDKAESENLLEAFYGIYNYRESSTTERFRELCEELRRHCQGVVLADGSSCTFISHSLPFSVGFPEVPTTNLFVYPKLGISIVNGFAAEQQGTRGVNIAALVDPHTTDAPEIEQAAVLLARRGLLVRGFRGEIATVHAISQMMSHWPYDLLLIATHCGDVSGHRWTYEFTDSEGIDRRLVVDIALGIGQLDEPEMLEVSQFIRFHELDGVDWSDHNAKAKLYVGTAIQDYIKLTAPVDGELEPITKDHVDRISGSSALKMFDNNYIHLPRALAGTNTPIVFNNACVSWHSLAEKFIGGNARAYVGTLIEVTPAEASEVALKVFDKFFGKPLAHAIWATQKVVYGDSARRPYVVTGIYPQRIRTTNIHKGKLLETGLKEGLDVWQRRATKAHAIGDQKLTKKIQNLVNWHKSELQGLYAFCSKKADN